MIGAFYDFVECPTVKLIGVEAGGKGIETKLHAATMTKGKEAVIHGMNTMCLVEDNGDISPVYLISAGLDYPGVLNMHFFMTQSA